MNPLGQYFTTNVNLKDKVYSFIKCNPGCILEPSVGQGDLVEFVLKQTPHVSFDMYEIDPTVKLLDTISKDQVIYSDFLKETVSTTKKYRTIIGNPPYIRTKTGNLYIDFTKRCYELLENSGELIFIVPSDFFKLTCASRLLSEMMEHGTFTDIFHPHNEHLFANATIDVLVFRYLKDPLTEKKVLYNGLPKFIQNSNGLITFSINQNTGVLLGDYFSVHVGMVTGKESVYKNNLGNISVLNKENQIDKYIFLQTFPSNSNAINEYLLQHKPELIERKIKKFNENNWWEWGAPRNLKFILAHRGKDCIYINTLTRDIRVAFKGKVQFFGGGLICLNPKNCTVNLDNVVQYLNSKTFSDNFRTSGRFRIGQRQLTLSYIPHVL